MSRFASAKHGAEPPRELRGLITQPGTTQEQSDIHQKIEISLIAFVND
jgi:hypothetical protein